MANGKQVGFFVPGWPLDECPNGIVSYVAALRGGLERRGVGSVVFAPRPGRAEETDVVGVEATRTTFDRVRGFLLRRVGRPESAFADFDRALEREVTRLAGQGLAVFEMEETFGLVDRFRVPGVARVARLHGPWFLNGDALGAPRDAEFHERVRAEGDAIRRADAVSSPSADVLDRVREFYRLELPNARVIPNPGGDVPREKTWQAEGSRTNQILFVGRFDRHKGGDLVLDAFARLGSAHPELELVFAGPNRGLTDDSGRHFDLDEYVAEKISSELRPRLHLLGQTTPARIAELRRESAISIIASRYENFPMTAIEGLSYGSPIVAARAGGIPEIVEHEKTGLLFRPGDASDLADQVERLLARPDEARAYASSARLDFEARFAPDVVARSMLDFYQSIPGVRLGRV